MKKTSFKFFITAMAVVALSASCRKDPVQRTAGSRTDGVRVISVTFDHPTKATIDNFTPKFENNDKIRISNATESEECTVSVSDGNVSFATSLEGELTAIYPSSAAVLSTGAADAPIAASNNIKVPASQDGTARNAIIAKATIAAESVSAFFDIQTALFEITPPSGTTSITITSLQTVDSGGARTGTAVAINTDGATDAEKLVINAAVPSGGKSYVSLVPGVKLSDLSFDAGTSYGKKEILVTAITAAGKSDITAPNMRYTINDTGWEIEYVEIGGLLWGVKNLGATTVADSYSTCSGDFYAWGETQPYYSTMTWGVDGTTCSLLWSSDMANGYKWITYTKGNDTFREWSPIPYDPTTKILTSDFDVVQQKLGDGWRMPTAQEFQNLFDACYDGAPLDPSWGYDAPKSGGSPSVTEQGIWWCDDYYGVKGILMCDGTNKLFFPAVGDIAGIWWNNTFNTGFYWSSSLDPSDSSKAFSFAVGEPELHPTMEDDRCYGSCIRPVKDKPVEVDYIEIAGLKWATKNLGATTVAGSYETCAGDYYVWGSLNTIYDSISWSGTSGTFNFKSGQELGFQIGNRNVMEYTTTASLPDGQDVVQQKLGDGWRMPKNTDFQDLYIACGGSGTPTALTSATPGKGIYWLDKNQSLISHYTGVAGLLFVDDAGKKLFFPAAGGGGLSTPTALNNVDEEGHYWSSIWKGPISPYTLDFSNSPTVDPQSTSYGRIQGFSIRPVKD